MGLAWLRFRLWVGRVLNLAGLPAPLRQCEYNASVCKAHVSVRLGPLFTIVSINGLDVYFHRLTGKIDGVGFNQVFDCREAAVEGSEHLDVQPADSHREAHTRSL